jgi:purine-binding chemotaxis protein CheW
MNVAAKTGGTTQYATFTVAGTYLGVPVLEVQEVLRGQQLTRVPLAPDTVAGLINLRGQIVPALEMRRLLRMAPREEGSEVFSVVMRTGHGAVSLQVDEIADVLDVDAASLKRPPENVSPHLRALLNGVYKLKDKLLLVLDTQRTVESAAE